MSNQCRMPNDQMPKCAVCSFVIWAFVIRHFRTPHPRPLSPEYRGEGRTEREHSVRAPDDQENFRSQERQAVALEVADDDVRQEIEAIDADDDPLSAAEWEPAGGQEQDHEPNKRQGMK